MSAVPALILGGTIAGGLVCSAVVLGRSIDKLADNLAAAVGGIADTLSNGPRKPLLLQWVTGRADGGCATRPSVVVG